MKTVHVHSWACPHVNHILGRGGLGDPARADQASTRLAYLLNKGVPENKVVQHVIDGEAETSPTRTCTCNSWGWPHDPHDKQGAQPHGLTGFRHPDHRRT